MYAKIRGTVLHGVEAFPVTVEVNVGKGLGYFITGQPDDGVRESLSRIEVAIKSTGFSMPREKLSVNLSPAHVRKTGAGFDLPIAIGILLASGQVVDLGKLKDYILAGELGLDGSLYPVRGALCMAYQALKDGIRGLVLPVVSAREAALLKGIEVIGVRHLREVLDFIQKDLVLPVGPTDTFSSDMGPPEGLADFRDVRGQPRVKRALEIAAAGGHNILLIGPPGVGKSMLAKRLPSILPPMSPGEVLETTRIYSVVGNGESLQGLITARPFRNPHHTASDVALAGGGSLPLPGEISLAHNGVLFLDELYEFKRSAIEVLRQPLEEGCIRIARAKMSLEYPASFMLVAAMNPCFCGYFGHPTRPCICSKRALEFYRQKASGPLLERIDLHVEAESLPLADLMNLRERNESSADIRERVIGARDIQSGRYEGLKGVHCNAQMPEQDMESYCRLERYAKNFLLKKIDELQLSARSYNRILKLSRTIADLAGSDTIELEHGAEAVGLRCLDRAIGGVKSKSGH